jgi:hypothetical protein
MRVLLDVESADEPEYLCVLGRHILDRVSAYGQLRKEGPKVRERQVFGIKELAELRLTRRNPSARGSSEPPDGQVPASSTYSILVASPLSDASTAAIIHAQDSLRVQCTRNALTRFRDRSHRLLVLLLQPGSEANDATLAGLSMVGNLVTLQMTEAYVGDVPKALAIQALAGDYVTSEPRFLNGEHEVSLPVEPILRRYQLELPRSHEKVVGYRVSSCAGTTSDATELPARPKEITLDVDQRRTPTCLCPMLEGQSAAPQCSLPATRESKNSRPAGDRGTVYVLDASEGPSISARLGAFDFTWTRHCAYAFDECPDVEVLGAAASCTATPMIEKGSLSQCAYHCVASNPFLSLPLDLEFSYPATAKPALEQRWPARLEAVGQRLSTFTPPEQRRVVLDLGSLCPDPPQCELDAKTGTERCHPTCVDAVDQELEYVELRLPGERLVRVKPDGVSKVLDAPGLGCSDTVIYQHHGDQSWAESSVPVEFGRVQLPDSNADFHNLFGFSIQAGAGLSFPSYDPNQLSSRPHQSPIVKLEGVLSWRLFRKLFRWPLDVEARFGGTVGRQWYEAFRTEDPSTTEPGIRTSRRAITFSRVLLHGGFTYHIPYGFYGGLTAGASNNRPLFVADEAVVPMSFTFLGSARVGLSLTRFLRIETEGLVIPSEPTRSFEYTPLGAPRPSERSLTTYLALISFRFDDPL